MKPESLPAAKLLEGLLRCDNASATQLFHQYSWRLVCLARKRLDARTLQKVDPEDVVQSVFRSFFRMRVDGELAAWPADHLWNLLATITARKCAKRVRYFRAAVRNVQRESCTSPGVGGSESRLDLPGSEPTPEEALLLLEIVEEMMRGLDAKGRQLVTLYLQEYSSSEIADMVGLSSRSVQLLIQRVRRRLKRWLAEQ
jgi:RNA polymerase sigma factor (sigma-70 family)